MYDAKKILAKQEINSDELEHLLCMREDGAADFLLIDVREQHEFTAGHYSGALHIGKGVIERDIEKQTQMRTAARGRGGLQTPRTTPPPPQLKLDLTESIRSTR